MTLIGWTQVLIFFAIVTAVAAPLGAYMHRVLEEGRPPLGRLGLAIEAALFRAIGVDPRREQSWGEIARALLVFSCLGTLLTYAALRLQGALPWNTQALPGVEPALALDTAVSFATNTNWQAYAGESTMSAGSQMTQLAWHNFVSAASGIAVALVLARGITRRAVSESGLGNLWADLVRATVWVLLPISLAGALLFAWEGAPQTLGAYPVATTLAGDTQTIAVGPLASQESVKQAGTNGGGYFNANAAHPFENPTPLSNLLSLVLIFAIPGGLCLTYGRMAKDARQGWALYAASSALFLAGVLACTWAESQPNPALAGLPVDQSAGNMEGKEARFGVPASALYAVVTTDASCGAVNAMHDSFTPLGGLVPLANIMLGEVVFGGVGAGLYGLLVMSLLSVFIAGLMVGRTPELLGKKVEAAEVQLATLYVLVFPALILLGSAWSAVSEAGLSSRNNEGPHGLAEILYAYTSASGNNGSAFAGLNANTPWYNWTLALAMAAGRFFMIVPALAIAGSLVGKRVVPAGPGTFPTNGATFVVVLVGVIVIVGALTFFPALALGPIVEHFAAGAGKSF